MVEADNTYDASYPTIFDVASGNHTDLALVYGDSSKKTYSALAFQVVRGIRRFERVEGLLTLEDDESMEFGRVGEDGFSEDVSDPGSEVWRIDSQRSETVIEYTFAVPQDGVWVGLRTGDGDSLVGLREGDSRKRGFGASSLAERGAVLSDHTYIDTPSASLDDAIPTTALSPRRDQGIVRIDSREDGENPFRFAFHNESGDEVDIDITGVGMSYHVRPYTSDEDVTRVLEDDDARLLTYGGFGNTNPNLPTDWYDYAVDVGPDELMG